MSRTVFCQKLKVSAEGLEHPPYPGELGKYLYENISREAWSAWLAHQTILMNEYRLSAIDPRTKEFLEAAMQRFLLGEGEPVMPEAYAPPNEV